MVEDINPKPRPPRPKTRDDFEIAIICALPHEADAMIGLFDENWEKEVGVPNPYGKAEGDIAQYSVGAIGRHNIVVAHLPSIGKVPAAHVSAFCRMSFLKIKTALVVGVCGGAPSFNKGKSKLFLGDVVISDSVVQYDLQRRYPNKVIMKSGPTDSLRGTSMTVGGVFSLLKTARQRKQMQKALSELVSELLSDESGLEIQYPGHSTDLLFPAEYRHKHQDSVSKCSQCLSWKRQIDPVCDKAPDLSCNELGCDKRGDPEIRRLDEVENEKSRPDPTFHIGTYASADTVLKSGLDRDSLTEEYGIIAFEMEGAGAWNMFESVVVIKGVCDYADSHKNKGWQDYAAASAAACTKAFLKYWQTSSPQLQIEAETKKNYEQLRQSLKFPEMSTRRNAISSITPDTFNWIFASPEDFVSETGCFVEWLETGQSMYWVSGKLASGKSTLMKFIASHQETQAWLERWKPGTRILTHHFWKPGSSMEHNLKGFLCSLVHQIFCLDESFARDELTANFDARTKDSPDDWDPQDLENILLAFSKNPSQPVCYFIDGLDEIRPERDLHRVLQIIANLVSPQSKICVSSRPERLFVDRFHRNPHLRVQDLTYNDMKQYVLEATRTVTARRWNEERISSLASAIACRADGVFLWVVLVTNSLIRGIIYDDDEEEIFRRLDAMPTDIMSLYQDLFQRSAEDRLNYRSKASIAFSLMFLRIRYGTYITGRLNLLRLAVALLDDDVLSRYICQDVEISPLDCVKHCQNALKVLELDCAGFLHVKSRYEWRGFIEYNSHDPYYCLYIANGVKVDLIHRTAEEFLLDTEEGQSIWKAGDSPVAEAFSRHFQATLVTRRALDRAPNFATYMEDTEYCEVYTYLSELQCNRSWLPLKTLSSLLALTRASCLRGFPKVHRPHTPRPPSVGEMFLVFAAQYGFNEFILSSLEQIDMQSRGDLSLLIFSYCCTYVPAFMKEQKRGLTGVHDLIRHFLKVGLNPNHDITEIMERLESHEESILGPQTPWIRFLVSIIRNFDAVAKEDFAQINLETINAFLQAGADRNQVTLVTFDAKGLSLNHCFDDLPPTPTFIVFQVNAEMLLQVALNYLGGVIDLGDEVMPSARVLNALNVTSVGYDRLNQGIADDVSNQFWKTVRMWLEYPRWRVKLDELDDFHLQTRTTLAREIEKVLLYPEGHLS
ncbi:hypothetical protein FSARC_10214 [Fusarium sarcochroum]|uniref:Nucleoside phosphorylase domain-containing protein n=1 Tax=Fusarium sarcochroum TaxID=1208366 RepID=A0A8H4X547_9HYPO|nr:hypothetical protein FSARC_10214 [Fusarium sarcochroum]